MGGMTYPVTKLKRARQPVETNLLESEARTEPVTQRSVQFVATLCKQTVRPALICALGLLAVWLIGRVMEALHGGMVFDMTLTYWLGLVIYGLIGIWAIGFVTSGYDALRNARQKRLAILCLVSSMAMAATLLLSFKGYRISSSGLLTAIAGSQEASERSLFLLFKYHSMNPLLALNLVVVKMMDLSWNVQSFAPYVWGLSALLAFFIWSLAFGILLLLQKGNQGAKSVYLFFSAFGLLGLIILRSVSTPTTEQMIMIQAAAAILVVVQVLLAYTALRTIAAGPADHDQQTADTIDVGRLGKDQTSDSRFTGLGPSALKLAVVLFVVVPVVADMHNQFLTALSSDRIVSQVTQERDSSIPGYTAITAISIRSGPTGGDDIIGILPEGTHIQITDKQAGWVNIGENNWILEKFLTPQQQSP
jgi:hypothetical protein